MACTWQVYDYLLFIFMMLALQFFIVEFVCVQAKALAEKNQWDLQTQREQAERHVSTCNLLSLLSCVLVYVRSCWGWLEV